MYEVDDGEACEGDTEGQDHRLMIITKRAAQVRMGVGRTKYYELRKCDPEFPPDYAHGHLLADVIRYIQSWKGRKPPKLAKKPKKSTA
ncbi:hypothetical protein [Pseudacidovorax intermedius]|uniref:hypothetical protein n=1 Tax=Pseudacidovorax intermedius TaxID=433924 RepID=UPI0026F10DDB|nr:hypothetical protein [Pseudacidovorax intermedius]